MARTGEKRDGCATFYRTSIFKLVGQQFVEYKKDGCQVLDRDNVALLTLFETVQPMDQKPFGPSELLCVANTHILFNHNRGDVKLAQVRLQSVPVSVACSFARPPSNCPG